MYHFAPVNYRRAGALTFDRSIKKNFILLFLSMSFAVAAFIPITSRADALSSELDVNRVREIGLLMLALVIVLVHAQNIVTLDLILKNRTFLIVSQFACWALLSSLWSPNPLLTISKSIEFFIIALIACLIIAIAVRTRTFSEEFVNLLVNVLITLVGVLLLVNVVIWGTPIPIVSYGTLANLWGPEAELGRPRFVLGTLHALATSALLSLTIICLLASQLSNFLKAIYAPPLLTLLWLTDSRSSIIGLFIALPVMFFMRIKSTAIRLWLLGVGILLTAGYACFPMYDLNSIEWGPHVETLNGREYLWHYIVGLISDRPVIGYGYFASRFLILRKFPWAGQAHNDFLELLLSTGFIGLFLYAVFIVYLIYVCVKRKSRLLLGVGIYSCVFGMFDMNILIPGFSLLILLLTSMQAELLKSQMSTENDNESAYAYSQSLYPLPH
jgi:O-antigen ligase